MAYKPHCEQLENRILLSADLEIGRTDYFSFRDAEGDQVTIRINGNAGRVYLRENITDGVGNGDGILEDGENLGAVIIKDASPDFSLSFESSGEGNGLVQLGDITAISQVIHGVFTQGLADFDLLSFNGLGFSPGGGLQVDRLWGRLALAELAAATAIDIRKDLFGEVIIKDDLAGALQVGGSWTGKLIVGENFSGTITAAAAVSGEVQIIGDFTGSATIAGDALGRWLVVGSLAGLIQASGEINRLEVVRALSGTVAAGQQVWIEVGSTVAPAGTIRGQRVITYVRDDFWGDIHGTDYVYLHVGSSLGSTARAESAGPMTVVYGVQISGSAQLVAPDLAVHYRPALGSGTVISSVPYVITHPGLYRLAGHLVYGGREGVAIEIRASNVTIDMQGFTLVNTAGSSTLATGIKGTELDNVAVRNGTIRGFFTGLLLDGVAASRYFVEGIRAEKNWYYGIRVIGAHSILRNNMVLDTGGLTLPDRPVVIAMKAGGPNIQVENNIISGVVRSGFNKEWVALHVDRAEGAQVRDNIFAASQPESITWGLWLNGNPWFNGTRTRAFLDRNLFVNLQTAATYGDYARGTYSENILLDVPAGFAYWGILGTSPRPKNGGHNFQFSLALAPDVEQQLAELRRNYGFEFAGDGWTIFYQDWAGLQEKWFKDRWHRWYALLPDGQLYQWDGAGRDLSGSLLIAWLDPLVYQEPDLLFSAPVILSAQTKTALAQLRQTHAFQFSGNFYQGVYGQQEKWFLDRLGNWFALKPDGALYQWHGMGGQFGTQIAQLDPLVFDEPHLLFQAEISLPQELLENLAQLRTTFGFQFNGSFYQGVYGQKEKWFLDRLGNWFALKPDGALYQWHGVGGQFGTQIAQLDPLVFDDLQLLFQAEALLSTSTQQQLSQLRQEYGFRFHQSYFENWGGLREKWFLDRENNWYALLPDGRLLRYNGHNLASSEPLLVLDPAVYDDPKLLFHAELELAQQALAQAEQLRQSYGFTFSMSDYFGEGLWLRDRYGWWYALMKDGRLYQFNGTSLASSPIVRHVDPVLFTAPDVFARMK